MRGLRSNIHDKGVLSTLLAVKAPGTNRQKNPSPGWQPANSYRRISSRSSRKKQTRAYSTWQDYSAPCMPEVIPVGGSGKESVDYIIELLEHIAAHSGDDESHLKAIKVAQPKILFSYGAYDILVFLYPMYLASERRLSAALWPLVLCILALLSYRGESTQTANVQLYETEVSLTSNCKGSIRYSMWMILRLRSVVQLRRTQTELITTKTFINLFSILILDCTPKNNSD